MHGRGVQAEVLASLALVMVTAIGLLTVFFFEAHAKHLDRLAPLLGRGLREEAANSALAYRDVSASASWFRVGRSDTSRPHAVTGEVLGDAGLVLAAAVREQNKPLLQAGWPWQPIRFAMPLSGTAPGVVGVAVVQPSLEGWIVLGLLLADVFIFTGLGAYLLRRRVVSPLRQLASAAKAIEESGPGHRLAVEGVKEVVDVAEALSDMSQALERRNSDLEKAIADLRSANASLERARDGLDRSERLAAVGRLAAGVAHEVGNPMGAVLAFIDLAGRGPELSEASRGHLRRAVEQGLRVRTILGQLLDFSRPPRPMRTELDLLAQAEQAVALVSAQRGYEGVTFEVSGGAARALADESIVSQILLNLVLNAADAVAAAEGPRVYLALEVQTSGDVTCRVEDNGPGVPGEDRQRIFEPFFTTKPPGEGTGLGLANALRFAEELGGSLACEDSAALGGASFVLCLPAA